MNEVMNEVGYCRTGYCRMRYCVRDLVGRGNRRGYVYVWDSVS
jgi:hypothetical protein